MKKIPAGMVHPFITLKTAKLHLQAQNGIVILFFL